MKTILTIILFFAITCPCFAALTENDIRRIFREEIKPLETRIVGLETRIVGLETRAGGLETRMGELEKGVATIEGKMATKDDIITLLEKLGNKIETLYGIIIASFVTLIVVIAVPQIIIAYRERRESRLSQEVDELKRRIVELEGKKLIMP